MEKKEESAKKFNASLWIPVIMVFVIISLAWYYLIRLAGAHPIESIPLESQQSSEVHDR